MIDPDNPLPEASFTWRRALTFLATAAVLVLLYFALERTPPDDVLAFAQCLLAALVILWVLYFGGASADDVGRLVASVRLPFGRALAPRSPRETDPAPKDSPQRLADAMPPGATADLPPWERTP